MMVDKWDKCFDPTNKRVRILFKRLSDWIPGWPCFVAICVGSACSKIIDENRSTASLMRSILIKFVPDEDIANAELSDVDKVCLIPFIYGDSTGSTGFRVVFEIRVPIARGLFDYARNEIYYEGGRVQQLVEVIRNAIEKHLQRYSRVLMIVLFITLGASSTAAIDLIFKHLIEPLRQKAEKLGINVYTIMFIQISDTGTNNEMELSRRRDKIVETLTQRRGTVILYKWSSSTSLEGGELSNEDLVNLIEMFEAMARRDNILPPTDMGDILRDGAIYEVVAPPTPIGSQYYDELLRKVKELKSNEIHVVAVGGRLIDKVDRDLRNAEIEVRNKMVLKILKEDYPPTVLVLRKISLNEALKRIDEIFRAKEQTK